MTLSNQGLRFDIPPHMQMSQQVKNPMPYPSPFFDLASFYLPPSVKELFKWCRYYYKTNGLVHSIIFKMAEYPITDIIFEPANSEVEDDGSKKLEEAFRDAFDIKAFLIEIGLDRFTYGNAFATIYFPFIRFLECPFCKTQSQFEDFGGGLGKNRGLDFVNFTFKGTCPKCKASVPNFKVKDVPIKQASKVNLVRLNPEDMDVEGSSITGITNYYYRIPNKDRLKIIMKDVEALKTTPWIFIQAMKERKRVKLFRDRVFHFKRADISDGDDEWGMPLILPVMRDLFYMQVLRKVQEQIALEHLIPLRVLYPADNSSEAAPHRTTGLGHWRMRVEQEIAKWKRDPNHMPVMPVPLGYQQVGGDGKVLLLYQELRQIQEQLVSGMTVPQEFIFGGLSWSGSSISLRMLENHFLVYRRELIGFLNFIGKEIAKFLDVKPIGIKMQEFKMADDIQRKQLMIDLQRANQVSASTMMKEVAGIDASAEVKQMMKDAIERFPLEELLAKQAGLYQSKVQGMAVEEETMARQRVLERQERGDRQAEPGDSEGSWDDVIMMSERRNDNQDQIDDMQQLSPDGSIETPMDPNAVAAKYARELLSFPPEQQQEIMQRMSQEMPQVAALVRQKLEDLKPEGLKPSQLHPHGSQPQLQLKPLPEKLPPRRSSEKAVV